MKGVIVSAVIAVLLVFGSVAYTRHMENVSEELGTLNNYVIDALEREDYDTAREGVGRLNSYLDSHRTVLAATGNHEEFDKIEMNLSELSGYIGGGEQTDALSSCRVLSFLFSHLPHNYELKLENIL